MDNPCKYCKKRVRSVGDGIVYDCHDHCELYDAWKYERSEILGRIHMKRMRTQTMMFSRTGRNTGKIREGGKVNVTRY